MALTRGYLALTRGHLALSGTSLARCGTNGSKCHRAYKYIYINNLYYYYYYLSMYIWHLVPLLTLFYLSLSILFYKGAWHNKLFYVCCTHSIYPYDPPTRRHEQNTRSAGDPRRSAPLQPPIDCGRTAARRAPAAGVAEPHRRQKRRQLGVSIASLPAGNWLRQSGGGTIGGALAASTPQRKTPRPS